MQTTNITAPPLDLDLNSVDTSMPLIAKGTIADFTIAKVELKQTSSNKPMLVLELTTNDPTKSEDGHDLGAGIYVFHNINLEPSGKATWDMVLRNIASVTKAAEVNSTYGNFKSNAAALLQGKHIRCKVDIAPAGATTAGKQYRAKNEISAFMKAQ